MNICKKTNGYTLIEMIVVIAIILIVTPVLFSSILSLYKTHAKTLSRAFALSQTTSGVKEIVRDVRSAVYAENGALPIVEIATSSLTLYTDTDMDSTVERVRYFLDDTTIKKGIIEPTATSSYPESNETIEDLSTSIVNNETNTPVFRYFDATSTEITSSSDILDVKRIEVNFIGSNRFSGETTEVQIKSSASIRNLKDLY